MNPLTYNPNILVRFLLSVLPSWIKRAFVVCSFVSKYAHVSSDDATAMSRLNEILTLTRNSEGMRFPFLVSGFVWHDDAQVTDIINNISEVRDVNTLSRYASSLVDKLPECLKYGSRSDMIHDFTELFTAFPTLSHSK